MLVSRWHGLEASTCRFDLIKVHISSKNISEFSVLLLSFRVPGSGLTAQLFTPAFPRAATPTPASPAWISAALVSWLVHTKSVKWHYSPATGLCLLICFCCFRFKQRILPRYSTLYLLKGPLWVLWDTWEFFLKCLIFFAVFDFSYGLIYIFRWPSFLTVVNSHFQGVVIFPNKRDFKPTALKLCFYFSTIKFLFLWPCFWLKLEGSGLYNPNNRQ